MFTGIIEEIGEVASFKKLSNGANLTVKCEKVLEETKLGDSISVNGCCQTVVELGKNSFSTNISDETLNVTNFSTTKVGEKVNLERALRLSDRLGGHIVSGHIDFSTSFSSSEKLDNFYNLKFEILPEFRKYIVKKGSITINGISLTVADIQENTFTVAIIPHTFENTTLKQLVKNDKVNIETDIIAKYVENFVVKEEKSTLTREFLAENGFM